MLSIRFAKALSPAVDQLPGSDRFNRIIGISDDRAAVVDRISKRVSNATDKRIADGYLHDAAGTREISFSDRLKVSRAPHLLCPLQDSDETTNFMGNSEQLAGHYLFETVNLSDTSPTLITVPTSITVMPVSKVFNLLANNLVDFVGFYRFHSVT